MVRPFLSRRRPGGTSLRKFQSLEPYAAPACLVGLQSLRLHRAAVRVGYQCHPQATSGTSTFEVRQPPLPLAPVYQSHPDKTRRVSTPRRLSTLRTGSPGWIPMKRKRRTPASSSWLWSMQSQLLSRRRVPGRLQARPWLPRRSQGRRCHLRPCQEHLRWGDPASRVLLPRV